MSDAKQPHDIKTDLVKIKIGSTEVLFDIGARAIVSLDPEKVKITTVAGTTVVSIMPSNIDIYLEHLGQGDPLGSKLTSLPIGETPLSNLEGTMSSPLRFDPQLDDLVTEQRLIHDRHQPSITEPYQLRNTPEEPRSIIERPLLTNRGNDTHLQNRGNEKPHELPTKYPQN